MLSMHDEENQRTAFERAYADHAKRYAGLEGSITEIAAIAKSIRRGRRYTEEGLTTMWEGYQLAPYPAALAPHKYMSDMDRDDLELCIRVAKERLERLNEAERVEVWRVVVDGVYRHTATTATDAMAWLARLSAAYLKSPPADDSGPLDRGDRLPLSIEHSRVYPDQLKEMLESNGDKPEDIARW